MDTNAHAMLEKMKMDAIVHLYLQSGSTYVQHMLHNCLTIPNICIGAALSVSVFSQNSPAWKVASGVLAITSTVLSALTRQVRSGEIAQLHALATRNWIELIQRIEMVLLEPDVENAWGKVRELRTEASAILQGQPEPSLLVVSYFNKRFRSVPFALHPELADIAKTRAAESLVLYPPHRSPRVGPSPTAEVPASATSRYAAAGLALNLGGRLVEPEEPTERHE